VLAFKDSAEEKSSLKAFKDSVEDKSHLGAFVEESFGGRGLLFWEKTAAQFIQSPIDFLRLGHVTPSVQVGVTDAA